MMQKTARTYDGHDIELLRDVPYLGEQRAEKMDVYLPNSRFTRPLPAVLLIHGGGWRIGDKADEREINIGNTLANAGYAVFSINYLLNEGERAPDGTVTTVKVAWPQNFYDCKSALRFLRKNADLYGIDLERIAVMGGSAGGTFSMLLGGTANVSAMNQGGLYLEQRNDVSCVIDLYGPIEMAHRVATFAGANEEETQVNLRNASPITWLKNLPPTLVLHGTADALVPVDESRRLAKMLEAQGTPYWYLELAGAPHTFHLQPEQADLRPLVLSFLDKYLK